MFRRDEIEAVWRQLLMKKNFKRKDIEWLKKYRHVWKDYDPANKFEWARNHTGSVRELAMRIMNVLDAKKDRQELSETNVLLPKSYLLELARTFEVGNVYANDKTPNWQIENAILDAIIRQTGFRPL